VKSFKRRKLKKTNYRKRLNLLKSGKIRLVIRRSLNNFHIQFIEYEPKGDKTIEYFISKKLKNYGWKAHCGNIMAAYLSGLAAGKNAIKKGVKEAIVDIGLHSPIKGCSLFAVVKGVIDAGVSIPVGDIFPPDKRITGKHVEEYAKMIKNSEKYKKQFSTYIKNGVLPENISTHFEEIKNNIMGN